MRQRTVLYLKLKPPTPTITVNLHGAVLGAETVCVDRPQRGPQVALVWVFSHSLWYMHTYILCTVCQLKLLNTVS